jgi:hypothetical protein
MANETVPTGTDQTQITVPANTVVTPPAETPDAPKAFDPATDQPTNAEQQGQVNQFKANAEENEPTEEQKEEAEKEGTHPFNAEYRDGKLVVKIKLTEDILFLNPDLRSLGYRAGEIVEFSPIEAPDAETAQEDAVEDKK